MLNDAPVRCPECGCFRSSQETACIFCTRAERVLAAGTGVNAPLTPAMRHVLSILERYNGWVRLSALKLLDFLKLDDLLAIPAIIANGWVHHDTGLDAIRINADGRRRLGRSA